MTFALRPYQRAAVDATIAKASAKQPQMIVLPTGTGKTIVAIEIAEHFADRGPVLITMHLRELVEQWRRSFEESGWTVFVDRAEERVRPVEVAYARDLGKVVVVTTMQSMRKRRLGKWPSDMFALCLLDEAHRALAPSHRKAIEYFKAPWVGMTATAGRQGLANTFAIAYQETLHEMMMVQGWLTPAVWFCPPLSWDWKGLKPDLKQVDIDTYFDDGEGLESIRDAQRMIRAYLHKNPGQALIFMPTARTADLVASWLSTEMEDEDRVTQVAAWTEDGMSVEEMREQIALVARPVMTESVTARTEKTRRDLTMRRFRNGTLRAVANFGVFTEGVNVDDIAHVIMLRPTLNPDLYIQMIGRGTRLHSTIKHKIGDCADAAERHAIIAKSPKPQVTIVQLVPMRHGTIDFCGPQTLMYDIVPDLPQDVIRASIHDGQTLDEMKAACEKADQERREREQAAQEAEERKRIAEYERRRERSPYLVAQGEVLLGGEVVNLVSPSALLLSYDDLQLTWPEYRDSGRTPCPTAATFSEAKKAVVEYWHKRVANADKARFQDHSQLPDVLNGSSLAKHWRRWTTRRMEQAPRYRSPGVQQEFDSARHEMAERFRAYLEHAGMAEPDAHRAARNLFMLASAWTGRGVQNELHYWWTALDPSHINPASAYAQPMRRRKR